MFVTVVNSLIILAVCMCAGYIGRKVGILTDELNAGLSTILVKLALPALIFSSMIRPFSRTLLFESLATLVISAVVYMSGYFIGLGLARLMKAGEDEKRVWQFSLIFANVGYMGFPVMQAVFGYEALIYTSMANVSFNALAFSIGVYLFKRDTGSIRSVLRPILLNPALVAIYIGFVFFVTGFRLPMAIHDGLQTVGGLTVPLAMMIVGSILAKSRLLSLISDVRVIPVIFLRLIGIPLVTLFILRPFVHNQIMLSVIVMLAAMPVAALTVIFAEQYKGDTALSSKLVALSSFLCMLTIPLISLLLN